MLIKTDFVNLNRLPWSSIMECGQDYRQKFPGDNDSYFADYLLREWGIDIISQTVRIVDEQKYMLFLLRWS